VIPRAWYTAPRAGSGPVASSMGCGVSRAEFNDCVIMTGLSKTYTPSHQVTKELLCGKSKHL
jgi:hypothetical protein